MDRPRVCPQAGKEKFISRREILVPRRGFIVPLQVSMVVDERNGVDSGEAAHDKQGAGGTAEGKGACFSGWQRAGT